MQFVNYDAFSTIRFRYPDNSTEDIAILQENDEKWWHGDWDNYIFNMLESIAKTGQVRPDWESAMVIIPDWDEFSCRIHHFHIIQGDSDIDHSIDCLYE